MRARVLAMLTSGAIAALILSGCRASDKQNAPASAAPAATAPAASGSSQAGVSNRCPLTSTHVTIAVGMPMRGPDSACGFDPENGKLVPHVLFVLQNPEACRPDMLKEMNLKEKVEVLGVTAYMGTDAEGTHILACRTDDRPFEIVVDTGSVEKKRAVATTLAVRVVGKLDGL